MRQAPPQFSPDGLFWWDGSRWVPLALPRTAPAPRAVYQPPPPPPPSTWTYQSATPSVLGTPSPGLRTVLLVFLGLEILGAGLLTLAFAFAALGGGQDLFGYGLGLFVLLTFIVSVTALAGVLVGTSWSRWTAIGAGILICWWVVGAVIGIPILVTAARAPNRERTARA